MKTAVMTFILLLNGMLSMLSNNVWANPSDEYQYVALNFRGIQDLPAQDELAQYLAASIDKTIYTELIVPSAIVKIATIADLMMVNPVNAIKITQNFDFEIIATLKHRKVGAKLAGVIIVHRDSNITNISDLANKNVAIVDKKNAAAGFLFQAQAMLSAGLNPEKDFDNFIIIPNQNDIVKRVIAKHVDAGCIRSGQLENYMKAGGDISQLRIINDLSKQGERGRSTEYYPHWAFLVRSSIPIAMKNKIKAALFSITAEQSWLNPNDIGGFVEVDRSGYERLRRTMERLALYY